ncbi:MAG: hypothetical protein KDC34_20680, partial [Saprospiraceae bacterium]|nr:hypothetical protein [Saprospiraceae bacterium]
MKKLKFLLVVFAFMCFESSPAFSCGYLPNKIYMSAQLSSNKTIKLSMVNLSKHRTKLTILDQNDKLWYQEVIWKKDEFSTTLNFDGMPDGIYLLTAQSRFDTETEVINICEGALDFFMITADYFTDIADNMQTVSRQAPGTGKVITYISVPEDNKLGIQLANLKSQNGTVQIKAINGGVLFSENISAQNGFAKKIDLNGLTIGEFYTRHEVVW